jgi:nicotinamide-nucleotide amidase
LHAVGDRRLALHFLDPVVTDLILKQELLTHTPWALLAERLLERQWTLATAESCTGGLIAAACTDLAGSSKWFDCGFVSYSNTAKTRMLGVDDRLIAEHGAVSEVVVRAMAQGALQHSEAQVSLAVTGIAGPTGASPGKPVGTVWFAWVTPSGLHSERQLFGGDRAAVRQATLHHAVHGLLHQLQNP